MVIAICVLGTAYAVLGLLLLTIGLRRWVRRHFVIQQGESLCLSSAQP